jgi:hypothetical protein
MEELPITHKVTLIGLLFHTAGITVRGCRGYSSVAEISWGQAIGSNNGRTALKGKASWQ